MSVTDRFKAKEVESIWIDVHVGVSKKEELRIGATYRPGNLLRLLRVKLMLRFVMKFGETEIRRNSYDSLYYHGDFNLRGYEGMAETTECAIF